MADAIGLVALAGLTFLARVVVGEGNIADSTWIYIYLGLAVLSLCLWHSEKWPRTPSSCLAFSVGTLVLGSFFFGIDVILGHLFRPDLPLLEAGKQAGGPFGFFATLVVCPGLTAVALAGTARSLVPPGGWSRL